MRYLDSIREIRVIRGQFFFGCGVSRAKSLHLCVFAFNFHFVRLTSRSKIFVRFRVWAVFYW
jgi:hypothetical protein